MARVIVLSCGLTTLVDDEDFERASRYRWHLHSKGYVVTDLPHEKGKPRRVLLLHRFLVDAPKGVDVDHENRDRLDNRRSTNLRLATRSQNMQNRGGANSNSKSGVRGVVVDSRRKKPYRVEVTIEGKNMYIGSFSSLEEAETAAKEARASLMTHSPECQVYAKADRKPGERAYAGYVSQRSQGVH